MHGEISVVNTGSNTLALFTEGYLVESIQNNGTSYIPSIYSASYNGQGWTTLQYDTAVEGKSSVPTIDAPAVINLGNGQYQMLINDVVNDSVEASNS